MTGLMEEEEVYDKYGDTPLYFTHYYNFLFIFKSEILENGENEVAHVRNKAKEVIWKQEPEE